MAIYHLSVKPISRASGRSAVAAIAYRSAERLVNERDGLVHDFTRRGGVEHVEIVLPGDTMAEDGRVVLGSGPAWARDRSGLWNAAEASEKRKDARVAREIEIALPHELTGEQRLALTREFSQELARRYGVAVDFAIHSPHRESSVLNHHAHIMMTTRKVVEIGPPGSAGDAAPFGLGEKSALELENKKLEALGLPNTHEQVREIRIAWEQRANVHLARAGLEVRIDHRSHQERGLEIEPTEHMGVHATQMERRGKGVSRVRMDAATARRNAALIREKPEQVLTLITGEKSVFDRRDIARVLHRYIDDAEVFQNALARVMASPALMELRAEDPRGLRDEQGRVIQGARYSTREMVAIEGAMALSADRMVGVGGFGVAGRHVAAAMARQDAAIRMAGGVGLSEEQREAIEHVTEGVRIAAVVGLAGTGKSTLLTAAREAWEAQGYRVHGAALSGKAAEGLEETAGIGARTLASWEQGWGRGFDQLGSRDVFVIDEAGMVGSRQLSRFIQEADRAGAKVVLVGDPEQLQPIGPGAAFRAIAERVGFVNLLEVRRQKEPWQRAASVAFGRHRTAEGLAAYAERGGITFAATAEDARGAIVRDVTADMAVRPEGSRLVLAHRNADVQDLNEAIRTVRKERGELAGERVYRTTEGERAFAVGDRVLFRENDRDLGVKNGMLGTVERVHGADETHALGEAEGRPAEGERLVVRLDTAQGPGTGRAVSVSMEDYAAVDHGYATTIHKAQGATVDRAYVLASDTMDRHLTYVAMTRHREGVLLYAGRDEFAGRQGGVLVEHGAAPYEHDPEQRASYYVTLEREGGQQHTIWGVDLERAIAEAGVETGDRIGLEHTGSEPVRLPNGTMAERHSWQVRGADELAYRRLVSQLSRSQAKETTLDYDLAAYGERRGFDLRSHIVVPTAERASERQMEARPAEVPPAEVRPAEVVHQVEREPAPRRSKFAGLKLSAAPMVSVRAAPADRAPAAEQTPPLRESALSLAVGQFAEAAVNAVRMMREKLPVLPHQQAALDAGLVAIDAAQPGIRSDVVATFTARPELIAAAAGGAAGRDAALAAIAAAHEQRLALEARAHEAVRQWAAIERQYEREGAVYEWDAQRKVGSQLVTFARELKRDPQLENLMRERGREFGIAQGSRLDRVVQAQDLEHSLRREIDIDHGPRPSRGMSPGM